MSERNRFVLQAYHPEYACPAFATMFVVERLEELQALLGPDAQDDPQLDQKLYHLDAADIEAIRQPVELIFVRMLIGRVLEVHVRELLAPIQHQRQFVAGVSEIRIVLVRLVSLEEHYVAFTRLERDVETGNPQEREHILRADQIKDVNRLLVDTIEVVGEPQ